MTRCKDWGDDAAGNVGDKAGQGRRGGENAPSKLKEDGRTADELERLDNRVLAQTEPNQLELDQLTNRADDPAHCTHGGRRAWGHGGECQG